MEKKYVVLTFIFLLLFLIIRIIGPVQPYFDWTLRETRIANAILILMFSMLLVQLIHIGVSARPIRKLAHYLIIGGTAVTLLFAYQDKLIALGISVGILAIIFTFIFQAPLLSFFSWIYLSMGQVYRVGDRIRVGNVKGDVIDINLIRTKVLEVGGEYVQADLPSGRIITFPNSLILSQPVLNYTKRFHYIFVDLSFQLSYETDLNFLQSKMEAIIRKRLGKTLDTVGKAYNTALREWSAKDRKIPLINFNIDASNHGWIALRVTFPVDPHQQSKLTTDIANDILRMFKKYPRKISFPKGRRR